MVVMETIRNYTYFGLRWDIEYKRLIDDRPLSNDPVVNFVRKMQKSRSLYAETRLIHYYINYYDSTMPRLLYKTFQKFKKTTFTKWIKNGTFRYHNKEV